MKTQKTIYTLRFQICEILKREKKKQHYSDRRQRSGCLKLKRSGGWGRGINCKDYEETYEGEETFLH